MLFYYKLDWLVKIPVIYKSKFWNKLSSPVKIRGLKNQHWLSHSLFAFEFDETDVSLLHEFVTKSSHNVIVMTHESWYILNSKCCINRHAIIALQ